MPLPMLLPVLASQVVFPAANLRLSLPSPLPLLVLVFAFLVVIPAGNLRLLLLLLLVVPVCAFLVVIPVGNLRLPALLQALVSRHHPSFKPRLRARLQPCRNPSRRLPALAAEVLLSLSTLFFTASPTLLPAQQPMQMSMPMAAPPQPSTDNLPPLTPPTDLLTEAATRTPLTLPYFLEKALADNPTLAQTHAQAARTSALARQATLYPNPTIGYEGDQIRGGAFGGGEQGGFIAQTIPLGGKLTLRRRALEAEAQSDTVQTEIAQAMLRSDVTQAFYAAFAAQQSAKIRRDLLKVAQDAVQTAHQLANIGQADAPDILGTEVEQEQATIADLAAQRLYLARFHVLATLANSAGLSPAPLSGSLADTLPTLALDHIIETSPILLQAQSQMAAAEGRLKAARREIVPDLQLKAGEQYNFEQLGSAPANRPTGPQTFASAAITLPLWNRNQGNIAAAEAELEFARQNLRRRRLELQQQAQPLLETYLVATQQATLYRTSILPRASRAADLYERKYNQMAQAYPQVLTSRRSLLNLQLTYTEALLTIQRTRTLLESGTFSSSTVQTSGSTQLLLLPSIAD